jgi:DHA2 family multidrug resistance protein
MGDFTLQTNVREITMALIVQGIGFSLLFVPLTTVALAHVERRQISDASGLNSLVRQLGGSIGLAIFTSLLTRFVAVAHAGIAARLDPSRLEVAQRMASMQGAMIRRGMDAATAHAMALRVLAGTVARQAQVIAFDKSFVLGAVLMLALLPLVFFLEHPKETGEAPPEAAHVEA